MPGDEWLIGDRRTVAADRIYDAAADLMAREGLNALDIDKLAARVHCSRATIYRYVGGKGDIRDVVVARTANRIVDSVRSAVATLSGSERLITAILMTIQQVRSDPLCQLMIGSIRGGTRAVAWLTNSPLTADLATDLAGLGGSDPEAAQWIVRISLSLMYWPAEDDAAERRLVEKFVAPIFDQTPQAVQSLPNPTH